MAVKDIDIFEILVRQHEQMLHAYVLAIVKNPTLAEDIIQEAFLLAFQKLATLENKAAFPAWLRTIGRNVALQHLKKAGREVSTDPEILTGMEDIFSQFDDPAQGDSWTDRLQLVRECFASLPEAMLAVCRHYYFEDLPVKEIAGRTKSSVVAVTKRLERARDALRLCVEEKMQWGNS